MKLPRRFTLCDELHADKFLPRRRPAKEQFELSDSLRSTDRIAALIEQGIEADGVLQLPQNRIGRNPRKKP
jgi:hypothetical protein